MQITRDLNDEYLIMSLISRHVWYPVTLRLLCAIETQFTTLLTERTIVILNLSQRLIMAITN